MKNKNPSLFDVIVLGGGPAGSFFSYLMAAGGFSVLVLDRLKKPKRKVCGEYLCPMGVELLKEENLSEKILDGFPEIHGMKIVNGHHQEIIGRFSPQGHLTHKGVALNREIFDQRLVDLAQGQGVEFFWDESASQFHWDGQYWNVHTSRNRCHRAPLLIGADGRMSKVAREFHLTLPASEKTRIALHAFLENPEKNGRFGQMHLFTDGSYIGINPTGEHEVNISLVCDVHQLKNKRPLWALFNHYIQQSPSLKKEFPLLTEKTLVQSSSPITHRVKDCAGPMVALIGDAAGFIDPLTGEGIYHALWTGRCLARMIRENGDLWAREPQSVLKKYSREKRGQFRQKVLLNTFFQKVIRTPWLTRIMADFLLRKKDRPDLFVSMIGNIQTPFKGITSLLFGTTKKGLTMNRTLLNAFVALFIFLSIWTGVGRGDEWEQIYMNKDYDEAISGENVLTFTIKSTKAGIFTSTVVGGVKKFQLRFQYQKGENALSSIEVQFGTNDLDTDNEGRNKKMWNECLDSKAFPTIKINVPSLVKLEEGRELSLNAMMEIRGKSKEIPLTLVMTFLKEEKKWLIEGKSGVKFSLLEIPDPSIWIAKVDDDIGIHFKFKISSLEK